MSEDEPPRGAPRGRGGDLARFLVALGRVREDLERKIAAVADRIPTSGSDLVEEVAAIRSQLAWLTKQQQDAPPPFRFGDLKPEKRDEMWHELERWIAEVFEVDHPADAAALRCWRDHPTAVVHVTALWHAWVGAHRHPNRRHSDPSDWDVRHRRDLMALIRDEVGGRGTPCKQHPPEEPTRG